MPEDHHLFVSDPENGRRRAYLTSTVAGMAGVTQKTVQQWLKQGRTSTAQPLRGWSPGTEANPTGRWLIDADDADTAFDTRQPGHAGRADLDAERLRLDEERARLDDDRALVDLERRVHEQSRLEFLEKDNERLRIETENLRAKIASLGSVIRELTSDATLS